MRRDLATAFVCGASAGAAAVVGAYVFASRRRRDKVDVDAECRNADENVAEEPKPDEEDVPEDANAHCPGVSSSAAGKSEACAGCPNQSICASGEASKPDPSLLEVKAKLKDIKKKILVLSGKGGVGKSTVSAQLAYSLAARADIEGVGLLDVDITGPSLPTMLGQRGRDVHQSGDGWSPIWVDDKLAVMSIGFMLPDEDNAIIWRGPKKNGLIKQFLTDVNWGSLDVLLIDTPPGTSDEHLSVLQYTKECAIDGAIVVTTPQEVSLADVRKEINFCKQVGLPVLGVVENMSGFCCPKCETTTQILFPSTGGAEAMCKRMDVPFLGCVPMDGRVCLSGERGVAIAQTNPSSKVAKCLDAVVEKILRSEVRGVDKSSSV